MLHPNSVPLHLPISLSSEVCCSEAVCHGLAQDGLKLSEHTNHLVCTGGEIQQPCLAYSMHHGHINKSSMLRTVYNVLVLYYLCAFASLTSKRSLLTPLMQRVHHLANYVSAAIWGHNIL